MCHVACHINCNVAFHFSCYVFFWCTFFCFHLHLHLQLKLKYKFISYFIFYNLRLITPCTQCFPGSSQFKKGNSSGSTGCNYSGLSYTLTWYLQLQVLYNRDCYVSTLTKHARFHPVEGVVVLGLGGS